MRGRSKYIDGIVVAKICGLTREGGLCWEWTLREGPLYSSTIEVRVWETSHVSESTSRDI